MNWVVYRVRIHGKETASKAVCEQAEWEEMERQQPGYHTLVQAGLSTEGEAERLARATPDGRAAGDRPERRRPGQTRPATPASRLPATPPLRFGEGPMRTAVRVFPAHDDAGVRYTLRLLRADDAGQALTHTFAAPEGLVYLETVDGRAVDRLGRGLYVIAGPPNTRLTSDGPGSV